MSKQRHIAVLTGKRGGYGAMKPMLHLMENEPGIKLSLIVTDQHVNPKFGNTIQEIEKDFKVAMAIDMEQADGSSLSRSRALGVCLSKMSEALAELKPDILVLYGDRGEVLATAIAAVTQRIPIAHLQGGDLSGNVDEVMRHAMTKLSHIHFPSTKESGQRILKMGEEPNRVHVVGDNHVDLIVASKFTDDATTRERYSVPQNEAPIVVLLHPETTCKRDGFLDMCNVLEAVIEQKRRTFVVYPCSDHGYEDIIRAIKQYENVPGLTTHKNIEAQDFWGLLSISGLMLGNSSAGLIETPYFRLPAINIGERQKGREHADNLIHCGYDLTELKKAIDMSFNDDNYLERVRHCDKPFGDGYAYKRIVEKLLEINIGHELIDKRFVD